jgi:DNA-binding Lrp family transcriptional regulator
VRWWSRGWWSCGCSIRAGGRRRPHVLLAQRLFGEPDYLLRVVTRDLPDFQRVYDDRLSTLPGVQRLSSTRVMKTVVENRPLPL